VVGLRLSLQVKQFYLQRGTFFSGHPLRYALNSRLGNLFIVLVFLGPGFLDLLQKHIDITGFHEIVECPQFHAFDAGFDSGMTGQHDHHGQGMGFPDLFQGFNAVHSRHLDVQDHHIHMMSFVKASGPLWAEITARSRLGSL